MTVNAVGKLKVCTKQIEINGAIELSTVLSARPSEELILLESADIVTKRGEKSLLFLDLALRIESRNNSVVVTMLHEEARPLFERLCSHFCEHSVLLSDVSLTIKFEPLHNHSDLLEKMRSRSALDVLRAVQAQLWCDEAVKKSVMLSGAFSYDFLDHFEKLPGPKNDLYHLPDFIFYWPLTVVIVDHQTLTTQIFAHALLGQEAQVQRLSSAKALLAHGSNNLLVDCKEQVTRGGFSFDVDIDDKDFMNLVDRCKEHIYAGDVYQIVPSRTFSCPINDVILTYQILKISNPSPYMFFLRTHDWTLFGASPETFIKIDKGGKRVSIRPIAGTRRRGFGSTGEIDHELDSREQASLCLDEKELAEHMMLVDLARNDIASVAKPKSRRIKRLLGVDRFSHVMHLVSEVEGALKKGFDALSAYQASMNMGTLMGAPKVRAAELLRELEASKRGFYGGAIGYVDLAGDMDTAIIIRSALVKNRVAYVRAGCGVVFDSLSQFETQETINKAEAVLRAINRAGDDQ